jgi:xanthine dehydrogenase small subunit
MLHYPMSEQLRFRLNGQPEQAQHHPHMTVLEYLRKTGRVGTKEGCGDGDCGACTIAMIGQDSQGNPQYQAVNSCIMPLGALQGREVFTVEGISTHGLHPVQQAMLQGGSQCGYCTPGFIMSLFAAYYNGEKDDVVLEGNLCRCTGYVPIRSALRSLGEPQADDPFVLGSSQYSVISSQDDSETQTFYQPTTLTQVFEILAAQPEATLVAGGTDLGLELSHKARVFPALVSLEHVPELKTVRHTEDALEIGAGVTLSDIEQTLHGVFPALDEMIHWFAARQIRNRATVGGNLGTASPIGDLAPVLLALDASIVLTSAKGERVVALAEYFTDYRKTVRAPNEVIASVKIPKAIHPAATKRRSFAYKVGKRGTDDISIVAAAFTLDVDDAKVIHHARLAYGGVAAIPIRAHATEAWLLGRRWDSQTVTQAKRTLQHTFTPLSDVRASAHYRNQLVGNLLEKFFVEFAEVPA